MTTTAPECNYLFKYLLVGSTGAGKTSFLNRYLHGYFTENFVSTLGLEMKDKLKIIQSPDTLKTIKLQIWDPTNQERFKTITSSYYRGAHGIMVLFDCTDRENSFKQVPALFQEIARYTNDNVQKILVATKIDLIEKRQVPYEEGKQLADHFGVPYIETSAKNNTNINEAILTLTRDVERVVEKQLPKTARTTPTAPSKWTRCLIL